MNAISLRDFSRSGGVSCRCVGSDLPGELYYKTDFATSPANDWAAASLIYPAMVRGIDLHIDGPVSFWLLKYLNADIQSILMRHYSGLKRIEVVAEETADTLPPSSKGVATGFSAGVDSFCTLLLNPNVTHLTVFDVGALGRDADALFHQYADRAERFAEKKGMMAISVRSNLDLFFEGLSFENSHTICNAAAAHVLDVSDYLYSSSVDYSEVEVVRSSIISPLDPILLPLLSTSRLRLHSAGIEHSRGEKTRLIADMADARELLDVCVGNTEARASSDIPNCSKCWKCARTLLTLEALGRIEDFSGVFDLKTYYAHRDDLILRLSKKAQAGSVASQEALDMANSAGVPLPSRFDRALKRLRLS